jgi:hypothetical protein
MKSYLDYFRGLCMWEEKSKSNLEFACMIGEIYEENQNAPLPMLRPLI